MSEREETQKEGYLPVPSPKQCVEDLREDGCHPQATCVERMAREAEYHQHEMSNLVGHLREAQRKARLAEARADLAAERERELVEALRERDGGAHDTDCPAFRAEGRPCNCGHEEARALIATYEHNEGEL